MMQHAIATFVPTNRPAPDWQGQVDAALDLMRDDPSEGERAGRALMSEGTRLGDTTRRLHGELLIAHAKFWANDIEDAELDFERLENELSALGDRNGQWLARLGLLMTWRTRGKSRHAYDHIKACGVIPVPPKISGKVALLLHNCIGIICQECVETEEALKHFYAALDLARGLGQANRIAHVSMNIGELFYICGNAEDGEVMLGEAHRLAQDSNERWLGPFVSAIYALCLLALNREEDAYAAVAPYVGARIGAFSPHVSHQTFFLSVAAYMVANRGDLDAGEALCAEALALLDLFEESQLKPYTWWVNGHLLHRRGRFAEAIAALERAILDVGDLGYVFMPMRASEELMHIRAKQRDWEGAYREQQRFQRLFSRAQSEATRTRVQIIRIEGELREAENARRHAERASHAKSQYLASIGQEIRTPMNSVIGTAYLMMRTELDDTQREHMQKIVESGLSLLGVLNEMLDSSKIEAGHFEMEYIAFDLEEVFSRVATAVADEARQKELRYRVDLDSSVPTVLVGDPLRLGQVLINLASNGVKFTRKGDVVVSCFAAARATDRIQLRFSVRDTGVGMTAEQRRRLFDPSLPLGTPDLRREGSGQGLTIAKRLIDLMQGDLTIESVKDHGSTFSFTAWFALPGVEAANTDPRDEPVALEHVEVPWFDQARVLVAEDNALNRELAVELLQAAGIDVETAIDGRQAVEMALAAGQFGYDAILMDVQMPEMDGLEATRVLRATPGFTKLPIIAMTALTMREERERCLLAGMTDHISKPVDPPIFYNVLSRWLLGEKEEGQIEEAAQEGIAPAEPVELAELIASIDGLDPVRGLGRVSGNHALYGKLLQLFSEELRDTMIELKPALANDRNRAGHLAHRLKGSSGNIGAAAVHEAVANLDHALQTPSEGGTVEEHLKRLSEVAAHLQSGLSQLDGLTIEH